MVTPNFSISKTSNNKARNYKDKLSDSKTLAPIIYNLNLSMIGARIRDLLPYWSSRAIPLMESNSSWGGPRGVWQRRYFQLKGQKGFLGVEELEPRMALSGIDIDWGFIRKQGGDLATSPYVSTTSGKGGPIIGYGVDLGERSPEEIESLIKPFELSVGDKSTLIGYSGVTKENGYNVESWILSHPVTLTKETALGISEIVENKIAKKVEENYDFDTRASKFSEISSEAQTVIVDVAMQYGANLFENNNDADTEIFWEEVTRQNWPNTENILRDFHDNDPDRRIADADYLHPVIVRGDNQPYHFLVMNTNDVGRGSLKEAVDKAALFENSVVDFQFELPKVEPGDPAELIYFKNVQINSDPTNAKLYRDLGDLYQNINDMGAALYEYTFALQVDASAGVYKTVFYAQVAELQKAGGGLVAATSTYNTAFQIDQSNGHFLVQVGYLSYEQGKIAEARFALGRALFLKAHYDPDKLPNAKEVDWIAIEFQQNNIQKNPNDVNAWKQLTTLFIKVGDLSSAIFAQSTVVQLEPGNIEDLRRLVSLYEDIGDLKLAAYTLRLILQANENNVEDWKKNVEFYVSLNDLTAAIDGQIRVTQLEPSADSFTRLAEFYKDNGNKSGCIYALQRAIELGGDPHPEWFSEATLTEIASYIGEQQLPNGSIRAAAGPAGYDGKQVPYYLIDTYFADFAVIGMLDSQIPANLKLDVAKKWIDWRLANTNADGTIERHFYYANGETASPNKPADADDSAAATFLIAINEYVKAGGPQEFFFQANVKETLERIAGVMVSLQQPDGLTWGSNSYRVEQLADNSEVYAGLKAASQIEATVYKNQAMANFYADRAAEVQAGILNSLYDQSTGLFYVNIQGQEPAQPANFDYFYDNRGISSTIVWPAMMGVIDPTSAIAQTQIAALDSHWNGDPGHPDWALKSDWAAIGFAALASGDIGQALKHFHSVAQGPFPTPFIKEGDGYITVADAGFLLWTAIPFVNDDFVIVNQGKAVEFDVRANDYDIHTTSSDLKVTLVGQGKHGAAALQADGKILYIPLDGYYGADRFTYSITNSAGGTNIGTVTISSSAQSSWVASLPKAQIGVAYSQSISIQDLEHPLFHFQVTEGALPPGISITKAGKIIGSAISAGTFDFKVSALNANGATESNQYSITISGVATRFSVIAKNSSVAGDRITLTIRAIDEFGSTVLGYNGSVDIVSDDGALSLKNKKIVNGSGLFEVVLKKAGHQIIHVSSMRGDGLSGQTSILILPASVAGYVVTAPLAVTVGTSVIGKIQAIDVFGNLVSDYSGPVKLKSSDASAELPAIIWLKNGASLFVAKFNSSGSQVIMAGAIDSRKYSSVSAIIDVRDHMAGPSLLMMNNGLSVDFSSIAVAALGQWESKTRVSRPRI